MTNHIFGYGSLVNAESRKRTGDTMFVCSARVKGLKRAWNVHASKMTALGVIEDTDAICNGVIVSVSDEGLVKFDEREKYYSRIELKRENIEIIEEGKISDGPVWVYVTSNPESSDALHPIVQSYVDVVLTGFLSFGDIFAEEFMKTTSGWNHIVDDRKGPIYPRALERIEKKEKIDSLMRKV